MNITAAQDEWEVKLATPADVADLGLHQDDDVAAARFRRQLASAFGEERARHVGPAAETELRRARSAMAQQPVLWSGFLLTVTSDAAGPAATDATEPLAGRAPAAGSATTPQPLLVSLSAGLHRLAPPPTGGPLGPATLLSRALKARDPSVNVHLVDYGEVSGVASVRTVEAAERPAGGKPGAGDDPPETRLLAEVTLLFPEEEAMVVVTAATSQESGLELAVLLAGAVARTVRVRRARLPATGDGALESSSCI